MTQQSRKRKQISLDVKYTIIQHHNDGMRPVDIERLFEFTSSTVATIIKNKEKLVKEYDSNVSANGAKRNKLTMQIHQPKYQDIDKAVDTWFAESVSQCNVVIGGPEIKEQALRFAVFLQQPDFVASNGWLQKFRNRHHISYKTIVGEAGLVDKSVTDHYLTETLPNLIAAYKPEDIFNADETALFYRAQPAKTMIYKDMDANKVKQCKERLTLMLTANMDGSEKLKPLIIGKSASPRCFQGMNRANLPGYYRSNANGWMTGKIFKEWVTNLDRTMKAQKRHIILFVDNFSGHSPNKGEPEYILNNIKLAYFPDNCTSVIQPMDQGIINGLKIRYRTQIVRKRIDALAYGDNAEINVLDAINFVDIAWKASTQSTIQNCYRKAGFKCPQFEVDEEGLDIRPEITDLGPSPEYTEYTNAWNELNQATNSFDFNQDAYLAIDNHVPFCGVLTDEEIIAQIQSTSEPEPEPESEQELVANISKSEANKHLQALKMFLMKSSNDHSEMLKSLATIERALVIDSTNQTSITTYFHI